MYENVLDSLLSTGYSMVVIWLTCWLFLFIVEVLRKSFVVKMRDHYGFNLASPVLL